ncbi:MAG: hypothetical protein H5T86_07180 [Armatimonadetes bacterium]|nr:hypothetical protein [Armatimonadota bacterium]
MLNRSITALLELLRQMSDMAERGPVPAPLQPEKALLRDLVCAAITTPALKRAARESDFDISRLLDLLALHRLVAAKAWQPSDFGELSEPRAILESFRIGPPRRRRRPAGHS